MLVEEILQTSRISEILKKKKKALGPFSQSNPIIMTFLIRDCFRKKGHACLFKISNILLNKYINVTSLSGSLVLVPLNITPTIVGVPACPLVSILYRCLKHSGLFFSSCNAAPVHL